MLGKAGTVPAAESDPRKAQALAAMVEDFDARCRLVLRKFPVDQRTRQVFERGIARIDRGKIAALQEFIRSDYDRLLAMPAFKYLDLPFYLLNKARWIVALDLDRRPPERILDLGVGAGHFPFLAASYGHETVGIDMPNEIYAHLLPLYGIRREIQMIVPGTPLPECGEGFNLVTALQVTFNRPVARAKLGRTSLYWTAAEWAWLFDQLCARMRYPSRILFELNKQPQPETGADHALELMELFERNGASVDRRHHTVLFTLEKPLALQG